MILNYEMVYKDVEGNEYQLFVKTDKTYDRARVEGKFYERALRHASKKFGVDESLLRLRSCTAFSFVYI